MMYKVKKAASSMSSLASTSKARGKAPAASAPDGKDNKHVLPADRETLKTFVREIKEILTTEGGDPDAVSEQVFSILSGMLDEFFSENSPHPGKNRIAQESAQTPGEESAHTESANNSRIADWRLRQLGSAQKIALKIVTAGAVCCAPDSGRPKEKE